MLFILQDVRESDALMVEIEELRCELENHPEYSYITVQSGFFKKMNQDMDLKSAIPVGTLEFVQKYLKYVHHINSMPPIEIPEVLKKEKFLLRSYDVMEKNDIPDDKEAFVKDVSELKNPVYIGNTTEVKKDASFFKEGHLYQVSSLIDIMSEYRVTVVDDRIIGIQFYDGDCLVMPNEKEILKIQEMVCRYSQDTSRPEAYAMDVAVVNKNGERDLAIIELQPQVSMGEYGLRGGFLPLMYRKGIKWYLKQNRTISGQK